MEEDIERSAQAGFDDHIVKPLNMAQLEASIRRVTVESRGARGAATATGRPDVSAAAGEA